MSEHAPLALTEDPIVDRVIGRLVRRSAEGMRTYGQSMAANPAPLLAWLRELEEELLDAALYVERIRQELEEREEPAIPAGADLIWQTAYWEVIDKPSPWRQALCCKLPGDVLHRDRVVSLTREARGPQEALRAFHATRERMARRLVAHPGAAGLVGK